MSPEVNKEHEARAALYWCVQWLDTLTDAMHSKGMAAEFLEDLRRERLTNESLDAVWDLVGWTRTLGDRKAATTNAEVA
jgi:hypothetical protein